MCDAHRCFPDGVDQFFRASPLRDNGGRPGGQTPNARGRILIEGEDDNGRPRRQPPQRGRGPDAVDASHFIIDKDDIGLKQGGQFKGGNLIARFAQRGHVRL